MRFLFLLMLWDITKSNPYNMKITEESKLDEEPEDELMICPCTDGYNISEQCNIDENGRFLDMYYCYYGQCPCQLGPFDMAYMWKLQCKQHTFEKPMSYYCIKNNV